MRESNWEDAGAGVMLWAPAQVTSPATRSPLYTSGRHESSDVLHEYYESDQDVKHALSTRSAEILSSMDFAEHFPSIEQGPTEMHFSSRFSSPDTIAASSEDACFTPSESEPSTPYSEVCGLFFEQLQTFAKLAVSEPPEDQLCQSAPPTPSPGSVDSDSDGTDFLATPCPKRRYRSRLKSTGTKSHYFGNKIRQRKDVQAAALLNMGRTLTFRKGILGGTRIPSVGSKRTPSVSSLDPLRKKPNHPWTEEERILLFVIERFYCCTNAKDPTAIFNEITGLSLNFGRVNTMFYMHKSFGSEGSRTWSYVFDEVAFSAPEDQFGEFFEQIEEAAQMLGLSLSRRVSEKNFNPGSASKSKSQIVQERFLNKVGALTLERDATPLSPKFTAAVPPLNLGGCTITASSIDEQEVYTDIEIEAPYSAHLGFRVWIEDGTPTRFRERDGLVARLFANWQTSMMSPLPRSDKMFVVLANDHLSKQGRGGSAFVSVLTSLVQLFTYAAKMKLTEDEHVEESNDPRIALIDLQAPCLNTANKKHAGKDVIRQLRDVGEMTWTRYRGECEFLIFGNIDKSAILSIINLSDIESLCTESPAVAELLNLSNFSKTSSTRTACERMKRKNIILDHDTTYAMGIFSRILGLHGQRVKEQHVFDLITTLFDGWCVQISKDTDEIALSTLATTFATTLASETLILEQVMHAFIQGVHRGVDNISRYKTRRPGARRYKTI